MSARRLTVVLINSSCAEFSGWQSMELYQRLTRRRPVWNTRTRRWVTTPARAKDLVALAEDLGFDVVVTSEEVVA